MLFVFALLLMFGTMDVYTAKQPTNNLPDQMLNDKLHKMQAELLKMNERQMVSEAANKKLQDELYLINKRLLEELNQLSQRQQATEETNARLLIKVHAMNKRLVTTENNNQKLQTEIQALKGNQSNQQHGQRLTTQSKVYPKVLSNNTATQTNPSIPDCQNIKTNIDFHKRLINPESNHRVAFTAVLTHDVFVGYHQAIEFDKIITNIGNAYDANDGHLIAPIRGLYLLSISLFSVDSHNPDPIEIVKNGFQLAAVYVFPRGGQTILVQLEKGDKIWVRRFKYQGSGLLYGKPTEPYNSFSGVLLYEM